MTWNGAKIIRLKRDEKYFLCSRLTLDISPHNLPFHYICTKQLSLKNLTCRTHVRKQICHWSHLCWCLQLIPSSLISPHVVQETVKIALEILQVHFPPGKERETLHKVQPRIEEAALLPQSLTTSKASHNWEYPGELIALIISLNFLAITGGVRGSYQTQLYLITSSLPPSCFWHPLLEVFHCQLLAARYFTDLIGADKQRLCLND